MGSISNAALSASFECVQRRRPVLGRQTTLHQCKGEVGVDRHVEQLHDGGDGDQEVRNKTRRRKRKGKRGHAVLTVAM